MSSSWWWSLFSNPFERYFMFQMCWMGERCNSGWWRKVQHGKISSTSASTPIFLAVFSNYFFLFSSNISFFFLLILFSLFSHYFCLSFYPGVWWGLFSLPHGKGKAWLKRGFLQGYVSVAGKWILHRTAPYLGHIWPIWPITRPLTALERHKSVAGCYSHIQTNIWPRIAEGLIIPAAFQLLGEKNLCKHRTGRGEAISGLSSPE